MARQPTRSIASVKQGIVSAIRGAGHNSGAVVEAISKTVVATVEGVGEVVTSLLSVIADVARGAIHAIEEMGGDVACRPPHEGSWVRAHRRDHCRNRWSHCRTILFGVLGGMIDPPVLVRPQRFHHACLKDGRWRGGSLRRDVPSGESPTPHAWRDGCAESYD